jgi:DNA-directed RNA polymerase specialized sigma24 family protein
MLHDTFREIWRRLLAGDQEAAAWLVNQLKPRIWRRAKHLMRSLRIPGFCDGEDTCQWVLGHFLVRACRDQLHFPNLTEVTKFVFAMTRNRVVDLARRHRAERALQHKHVALKGQSLHDLPCSNKDPSEIVHGQVVVEQVRQELSDDDWRLVWSRIQGQSWQEIAGESGSTSDAARMRYARVVERVKNKLAN